MTILPGVNIGSGVIIAAGSVVPKIGANVFIGPYAMILGDIKIGDNATIGSGTLVMKDIEAGATYTGNTKMIRRR